MKDGSGILSLHDIQLIIVSSFHRWAGQGSNLRLDNFDVYTPALPLRHRPIRVYIIYISNTYHGMALHIYTILDFCHTKDRNDRHLLRKNHIFLCKGQSLLEVKNHQ